MKNPQSIIDQLSADDALAILKILIKDDTEVARRIAEVAMTYLSQVDPEEEADMLYDELEHLEVEEIWDRAGPTRHGYVEPHEAAETMVAEIIEPYLAELKKYQALGLNVEANRLCMGLLLGLYRFEHESTSEFKNWASEVPVVFAEEVVRTWQEVSPNPADRKMVKVFIEDELAGWQASLLATR